MSSETTAVIDDSVLESYRVLQDEGQPDLITELIDVFLDDLPARLGTLRQSITRGDPAAIKSAAHALKGSSGSVGAVLVAGLCAQLEAIGRAGSAEGCPDLLAQLEPEVQRAERELAKYRRP